MEKSADKDGGTVTGSDVYETPRIQWTSSMKILEERAENYNDRREERHRQAWRISNRRYRRKLSEKALNSATDERMDS